MLSIITYMPCKCHYISKYSGFPHTSPSLTDIQKKKRKTRKKRGGGEGKKKKKRNEQQRRRNKRRRNKEEEEEVKDYYYFSTGILSLSSSIGSKVILSPKPVFFTNWLLWRLHTANSHISWKCISLLQIVLQIWKTYNRPNFLNVTPCANKPV